MPANLTTAGYMIQDKQGYAIFGVGPTFDSAWAVVDGIACTMEEAGQ